jgi:glyoxylase-like metal-dependent hydrolase (beta-lactamase superfamily II)
VEGPVELAPGVHGLGSELVNWYLVEDEGRLTAVDAGLPGFGERLEADLARLGHTPGDVEAVVLTHSDADHTGIAPRLQAAGASVLIHAADEGALRKPGPKTGDASPRHLLANLWRPSVLRIVGHMLRNGAKPAKVEGAETFADGDVLDVPGRPRVVHTPGHTPGHCALLFEGRGALFVGDALCTHELLARGGGPCVMPSYLNADNRACLDSLGAIEHVQADLLLPGHCDPWRQGAASAVARARAQAGVG